MANGGGGWTRRRWHTRRRKKSDLPVQIFPPVRGYMGVSSIRKNPSNWIYTQPFYEIIRAADFIRHSLNQQPSTINHLALALSSSHLKRLVRVHPIKWSQRCRSHMLSQLMAEPIITTTTLLPPPPPPPPPGCGSFQINIHSDCVRGSCGVHFLPAALFNRVDKTRRTPKRHLMKRPPEWAAIRAFNTQWQSSCWQKFSLLSSEKNPK